MKIKINKSAYTITRIEPLENFRLLVEFSDGFSNILNLNKMLKHKDFSTITSTEEFQKVFINKKGDIQWESGAEICKKSTRNLLEMMKDISTLKLPINV
jgi:hypothetical protein